MDIKFETTKEYKKLKRDFIIKNFGFGFCYFLFLINFITIIVGFILFTNREIIVVIWIGILFLIFIFIILFYVIKEHISEIKEYKVMLLKKRMLPLENIIGTLGEGKMLRGGVDKIE
ncbi:MAG: hypothetical protein OHM56_01635 [Spiroplasma phoeniceum]|nr:MAG: hypothetical protein OHM57_01070 [Spiroplasma phoeniceum]UZQ32690.1 MAG: hypothetical protein OHM56_01635 [Spiroplasma phoeniceum]